VLHADLLGDRPARRDAEQVCRVDAEAVEHAQDVVDEVGPGVARLPRGPLRRPAGVAAVVADHVPAARGEAGAQLVVPPVHRARVAADEQQRGVVGRTDALHAELDVAVPYELFHCNTLALGGGGSQVYCLERSVTADRPR
jgi:hypothetical protein